eukprot:Tbor_TRINITY_DN3512_c0_g1::TRINITY_DN3512_c0_g1_i1::g.2904::m.2904
MSDKHRLQLLEELQGMEALLKQYTNPRSIGMCQQAVPEKDINILKCKIDNVTRQLEVFNDSTPSADSHIPSCSSSTTHYQNGMRCQAPCRPMSDEDTRVSQFKQHEHGTASGLVNQLSQSPSGPSNQSQYTRRDAVWQCKYEKWLRKNTENTAFYNEYKNQTTPIMECTLNQVQAFQQLPSKSSDVQSRLSTEEFLPPPGQGRQAQFGRRAIPITIAQSSVQSVPEQRQQHSTQRSRNIFQQKADQPARYVMKAQQSTSLW